jgi:hypothetical protein
LTLFLLIYFQVYTGVPKDYTKEFATNETFIKILLGEDIPYGSGKTLKTGPNDFVFVYFSDHGAKGIVAFGDNYLTAQTLNNVNRSLKHRHDCIANIGLRCKNVIKTALKHHLDVIKTSLKRI